jgi:pimeloyl-ACP methyl ester carboxylesterase
MTAPWVLLRGLTREAGHWGAFPDQLAQALPGVRIVALDLPGAGGRRDERSPWRVEAIAEACRAELQRRGIAPPLRLLGLSLGGMVAMAWAKHWPGEVERCVLVNTSLRPHGAWHRRLRPAAWPALLRVFAGARDASRAEQAVLALTSAAPHRHADVLDEWVAIRRRRPISAVSTVRQFVAAARCRDAGAPPALPVLVACSEGDRLVDARCSRALAERWNASLVVHPGAGHDLPLDDGPWLAARIAEWAQAPPRLERA